ncbi:MAG: nitroreductase family protein [Sphaerochaetaceae bacterium]
MNGSTHVTGASRLRQLDGTSRFEASRIRPQDLQELLEAVALAPSNANCQPWELVVTEASDMKATMAEALLDVQFRPGHFSASEVQWFTDAPLVLTLAIDRLRAQAKAGAIGADRFALVDIGCACTCLLLRAAQLGMGATIVREFDRTRIATVLGLPSHVDPVLLLVLGYSVEAPRERPRLRVDEYVHLENWNGRADAGK